MSPADVRIAMYSMLTIFALLQRRNSAKERNKLSAKSPDSTRRRFRFAVISLRAYGDAALVGSSFVFVRAGELSSAKVYSVSCAWTAINVADDVRGDTQTLTDKTRRSLMHGKCSPQPGVNIMFDALSTR